jgi:hypothetical protein
MVEMTPINQENEKCGEGEDEKGFQQKRMISNKRAVLICLLYRIDDSQWERA